MYLLIHSIPPSIGCLLLLLIIINKSLNIWFCKMSQTKYLNCVMSYTSVMCYTFTIDALSLFVDLLVQCCILYVILGLKFRTIDLSIIYYLSTIQYLICLSIYHNLLSPLSGVFLYTCKGGVYLVIDKVGSKTVPLFTVEIDGPTSAVFGPSVRVGMEREFVEQVCQWFKTIKKEVSVEIRQMKRGRLNVSGIRFDNVKE